VLASCIVQLAPTHAMLFPGICIWMLVNTANRNESCATAEVVRPMSVYVHCVVDGKPVKSDNLLLDCCFYFIVAIVTFNKPTTTHKQTLMMTVTFFLFDIFNSFSKPDML